MHSHTQRRAPACLPIQHVRRSKRAEAMLSHAADCESLRVSRIRFRAGPRQYVTDLGCKPRRPCGLALRHNLYPPFSKGNAGGEGGIRTRSGLEEMVPFDRGAGRLESTEGGELVSGLGQRRYRPSTSSPPAMRWLAGRPLWRNNAGTREQHFDRPNGHRVAIASESGDDRRRDFRDV